MNKKGFTLAEVLITLLIIGIVAALTIPSFISMYEQQQFKAGLKKAVNVLNNAIAANLIEENENLLINTDAFNYLQRHMSVLKTTGALTFTDRANQPNAAFYTADGMRFEFNTYPRSNPTLKLHESDKTISMPIVYPVSWNVGCGSYGLKNNPNNTKIKPCFIIVDVNGDKGPTPTISKTYGTTKYYYNPDSDVNSNVLGDIFTVMITEDKAIPYGVVAQRAMYSK